MGILSILTFVASLILIPIIIARLPQNYFSTEKDKTIMADNNKNRFSFFINLFKNLVGILFIIAGVAMLILPGQGLLTILIGLGITNFPGKHKLERKLINNKHVFKSLNWIRKKAGVEPFTSI